MTWSEQYKFTGGFIEISESHVAHDVAEVGGVEQPVLGQGIPHVQNRLALHRVVSRAAIGQYHRKVGLPVAPSFLAYRLFGKLLVS